MSFLTRINSSARIILLPIAYNLADDPRKGQGIDQQETEAKDNYEAWKRKKNQNK